MPLTFRGPLAPRSRAIFRKPWLAGTEKCMPELEPVQGQIINTTDARQGVTGHNVHLVLAISLLMAATAGVVLVGYFWVGS